MPWRRLTAFTHGRHLLQALKMEKFLSPIWISAFPNKAVRKTVELVF